MDEKWGIDFKKFKKSSSKKLIKGGLGFLLSPREEVRDINDGGATSSKEPMVSITKKSSLLESEQIKLENDNTLETRTKDYIDDILVIPSIDDFVDDDLCNQVAKAPLIGIKQVTNYKELESDVLKHSSFASFEEINLRTLVKFLHSDTILEEPDIPWTKEGLFNEVVTKVNDSKM